MTILIFSSGVVTDFFRESLTKVANKYKIPLHKIKVASVLNEVDDATKKFRNAKVKRINPEKTDDIREIMHEKVAKYKPTLIVVMEAAALGILTDARLSMSTLEKCRGSVFSFEDIPAIVTIPFVDAYRNFRVEENLFQEEVEIRDGQWYLLQDWRKIANYYHGGTPKFQHFSYSVIRELDDFDEAIYWAENCIAMSVDIETTGKPTQIEVIGFCCLLPSGARHSFVLPFVRGNKPFWNNIEENLIAYEKIQHILSTNCRKVFHNGNYDLIHLLHNRLTVKNALYDTSHIWHSMYPELRKSLYIVASVFGKDYRYWKDDLKESGGVSNFDMETEWRYNGLDTWFTLDIFISMMRQISTNKPAQINLQYETFLYRTALKMSMIGFNWDLERREEHKKNLEKQYNEKLEFLRWLVCKDDFNPASPAQLCNLFYNKLKATKRNAKGRIVKDGKVSAGKDAQKFIASEHPFFRYVVERIKECKEPATQISNVINREHDIENRGRTSYGPTTKTWRFSSSTTPFWDGGNVQNIRADMRDIITADQGCFLLDIDYSQSDAFFVAFESQDPIYIETMTSGMDTHAVHAEFFFKIPYEEVMEGKNRKDPKIVHPVLGIRQITKRVVHGANFMMGGPTLYTTMGHESIIAAGKFLGIKNIEKMTETQLHRFADEFLLSPFRCRYGKLNVWYKSIQDSVMRDKCIKNCYNYTRKVLQSPQQEKILRDLVGFMGQSGTSGNINRVLMELDFGYIPQQFRDAPNPHANEKPLRLLPEHGIRIMLQTHDSITFHVDPSKPKYIEGMNNILTVMKRPVTVKGRTFSIPIEAEIGFRWGKKMIPWNGGDVNLEKVFSTK